MVAHLSIVEDKTGNDLLGRIERRVQGGVITQAEIPSEDVKGAFIRFHEDSARRIRVRSQWAFYHDDGLSLRQVNDRYGVLANEG